MADFSPMALVALVLIAAAGWLGARWPTGRMAAITRWLEWRWAPGVIGLVSAAPLWWNWGSLHPVEVIHDETAYLLQAAMLAGGHLVGPARPLPEFFEQFQVFSSPILAAKYPPGFALALVPGIWLGLPGLIPVLLIGCTGGLLFALGRRLLTPAAALLGWSIWLVAPGSIPFRQLIMSETLTTALWLAGWWWLLEWRESGKRQWLILVAMTTAWCVITRPLTGLGYGIVISAVVVWLAIRTKRVSDLIPSAAAALLILAILPWQNRAVTGSWTESAWSHYTRVYAPSDHFGFGIDSTPPLRGLPPDFQDYVWYYGEFHRDFGPTNLPRFLAERSSRILGDAWGPMVPVAALLAGLGLAGAGSAVLVATATALLLVLLHLGFAHPPEWSIYYEETIPVLALLTAIGTARVVGLIGARARPEPAASSSTAATAPALLLLGLAVLATAPARLSAARQNYRLISDYHRQFRQRVAALPGRTIVFVRYAKNHIFHRSLISNAADLASTPSWIVYDRGADNRRLLRFSPDRTGYLYLERGDTLRPLTPADTSGVR